MSVQLAAFNEEACRERLRRMSDTELADWGRAARYMASPEATHTGETIPVYVTQYRLAREEWERRHTQACRGRA